MRKICFFVLAALSVLVLKADVVMKLHEPSRTHYIQYEPIMLTLTMRNSSGQPLIFGSETEFKGHLEVEVTNAMGKPLKGNAAKINLRGLILKSGVDQSVRINLSKWLDLTRPGTYRIRFFISHPMLRNEYQSNIVIFEVSAGKIFWSKRFGVPQMDTSKLGEPAPMRTYNLRALQDRSEVYFYLFIEDDEKIYSIKSIGMLLGRENPKCEIDSINRLHILLPLSPKIFHYMVFDWNGQCDTDKIYRTAKEIPVLFRNPATGEVKVVGGEAAQPGVDYTEKKLRKDSAMPQW